MPLKSASPLTLTRLAVTGSALILLSYVSSFVPFANHPHDSLFTEIIWNGRYELLLVALPFLAGILLSWRCTSLLGKGVRALTWPEQELGQARAWIESPIFGYARGIIAIAFLSLAVLSLAHQPHRLGFTYTLIFALNPITTIRTTLKPALKPGPRIDWAEVKPLHSDNWGQPPTTA